MSFDIGRPIRFAKKPAKISPKLPIGTANLIKSVEGLNLLERMGEKYDAK